MSEAKKLKKQFSVFLPNIFQIKKINFKRNLKKTPKKNSNKNSVVVRGSTTTDPCGGWHSGHHPTNKKIKEVRLNSEKLN